MLFGLCRFVKVLLKYICTGCTTRYMLNFVASVIRHLAAGLYEKSISHHQHIDFTVSAGADLLSVPLAQKRTGSKGATIDGPY